MFAQSIKKEEIIKRISNKIGSPSINKVQQSGAW